MKKRFLIITLLIMVNVLLVGCDLFGPTTTTTTTTTASQTTTTTTTATTPTTPTTVSESELVIQLKYIYNLAVGSGSFTGTYEEWLETVRGPQGIPGREVTFRIDAGFIQWQYVGDAAWTNLLELATLIGPQGVAGQNGKEIALRVDAGWIQWQYAGDPAWTNLIEMMTLVGPAGQNGTNGVDGKQVVFRLEGTVVQWQYLGDAAWTDLFDIANLVGSAGLGILKVELNDQGELIVTYTDNTTVNLGVLVTVHSVVFKDDSGYVLDIQVVQHGNSAVAPADPVKTGHTFVAWDKPFASVTENLVVVATFAPLLYDLTFDSAGGNAVPVMADIPYGTTVTLPIPIKDGYDFVGWFLGASPNAMHFTDSTPITADQTLIARWVRTYFEIVFVDELGNVLSKQYLTYQMAAIAPQAPAKLGHTFTGWDKDFSSVEASMTIHPLYEPNTYSIEFVGGGMIPALDLLYGDAIVLPNGEPKVGHTFEGWTLDAANTVAFEQTVMGAADLTLYAHYAPAPYTLTFVPNNQSPTIEAIVLYGDPIDLPADPTKMAYDFAGWYLDDVTFLEPFEDTVMGAADVTVYAKWTPAVYELIFVTNGGSAIEPIPYSYLDETAAPEAPTRPGFDFVGWFADSDLLVPYVFGTMPAQDVSIYAKWELQPLLNFFYLTEVSRTQTQIVIRLILGGNVNANGYDGYITFDSTQLTVSSYVNGLSNVVNTAQDGKIIFNYSDVLNNIASGTTIMTITFDIIDLAGAEIGIVIVEATDVTETYEIYVVEANTSGLVLS